MRFRTTILGSGQTATGIVVPDEIVEAVGGGRRAKVKITLNGHTYRSSIATVSGASMVGVSAEVRRSARVAGGDTLDVDIELDTEPRTVEVPPALAEALAGAPEAKRRFEALSYSRQRALTGPIDAAKTADTRQRNVDRAMAALATEKA